mmetsp:Transcript_17308/g.28822  ORF Transcript_17308/g.28822 Transcript_17308/m.28822 type:complete len:414 (+) Transcript_17308:104-1345(+)
MSVVALLLLSFLRHSLAAVQHGFLKRGILKRGKHHRAKSQSMKVLYPFYHSTEDIHDELVGLASRCPGMTLETKPADDRSIDVITIRSPGASPVNKNFLLFGEHARELISPESGLHFVKSLCGETSLKDRAAEILQDSEFQIVVNGNPESRRKVEQGDFCLRVNPDGVDLNRNWDEEWQPSAVLDPADTNPGPKPFSEPETQVFKELVTAYKPTNFLTIHSGTKGMYMPWAYDMEHLATRNQPAMMRILKDLDNDHCQCPFGAAGREVGYSCPGTCLDWVYDKLQTPYAFAFEIYTNPMMDDFLKERWTSKMHSGGAFYQVHSHLAHRHFHDVFAACPSDFVQLKSMTAEKNTAGMSPQDCFGNFNPDSQDEFDSVIENWSKAYLDLAGMIVQDIKRGVQPGLATNATQLASP